MTGKSRVCHTQSSTRPNGDFQPGQNNITIAPTINASGADGEQVSADVVTTIKHIVNDQIFKLKKQKLLNA
ncbi:hypothetical protein [Piscirickettsia salmonis]|uniref:hypothetical protein n=1 Tax=Piscirickettsia salmonis TaxID=1238 RepID=UPI001EE434BF|nr:hypothetical protein [Piscirickettsia salmonis]